MSLSLFEGFSQSFEAAAGVLGRRTSEISASLDIVRLISVIEVPTPSVAQRSPEQAPVIPTSAVDFVPVAPQAETLAPIASAEEVLVTTVPTNATQSTDGLNPDEIRAKLSTLQYSQFDPSQLTDAVIGGNN